MLPEWRAGFTTPPPHPYPLSRREREEKPFIRPILYIKPFNLHLSKGWIASLSLAMTRSPWPASGEGIVGWAYLPNKNFRIALALHAAILRFRIAWKTKFQLLSQFVILRFRNDLVLPALVTLTQALSQRKREKRSLSTIHLFNFSTKLTTHYSPFTLHFSKSWIASSLSQNVTFSHLLLGRVLAMTRRIVS